MASDSHHDYTSKAERCSSLLAAAKPFLRWGMEAGAAAEGDCAALDPALPGLIRVLRGTGAAECWHKHGTFLEHLQDVYRILTLWGAPAPVALCGLFHSAYSNSYVNLAIFKPDMDRRRVQEMIGLPAEHLVHLFCIVPRHQLIHDMLLFRFTDEELMAALSCDGLDYDNQHDADYTNHHANGSDSANHHANGSDSPNHHANGLDYAAACRAKVRAVIPPEGLTVQHIRTGEDVHLSRSVVATFLLLTMADFIDQLTGWQDAVFKNKSGTLSWEGNNWTALWPGDGKPGLWMSAISKMGVLLNLILKEEEEAATKGRSDDGDVKVTVPPVFNGCTAILSPKDQIKARDLYWEAVHLKGEGQEALELAKPLILEACTLNPWIGEPHILLAQVYLSQEKFSLAEREATLGLSLLLEWGTNWDKRISWEGWVAWSRVLQAKAQERAWPNTSWGILNLGLVK